MGSAILREYKGYQIGLYCNGFTKHGNLIARYRILENDKKTEIIDDIKTLKEAKLYIDEMIENNV
jgi:hypothetical protein